MSQYRLIAIKNIYFLSGGIEFLKKSLNPSLGNKAIFTLINIKHVGAVINFSNLVIW